MSMTDTPTSSEVSDDEMPDWGPEELGSASKDTEPLVCHHPGCDNVLTYSGRGPKPKFCDEHKRNRSTTGTSTGRKRTFKNAAKVEAALLTYVGGVSSGLSFMGLTADGQTVRLTAPQIVHEIVNLAADDMRLRKVLETLAAPGRYGPLVMAFIPLIMGIAANHGFTFLVDLVPPTNVQTGQAPTTSTEGGIA